MKNAARVMLAVIAVVVVLAIAAPLFSGYTQHHSRDVTVTSKERVCDRNDCKYLVFTDHGTFRVTDALLIGRFNSSDTYGAIKTCHRYRITFYGWRLPLFSSYPNIVDTTDLGRVQGCEAN